MQEQEVKDNMKEKIKAKMAASKTKREQSKPKHFIDEIISSSRSQEVQEFLKRTVSAVTKKKVV